MKIGSYNIIGLRVGSRKRKIFLFSLTTNWIFVDGRILGG